MLLALHVTIPLYQLGSKKLLDHLIPLKNLEHCHLVLRLTHEDHLHEHLWVWRDPQTKIPHVPLLFSET